MIKSAISQQERIDACVFHEKALILDQLSIQDWNDLRELLKLLMPFENIVKRTQGNGGPKSWGSIHSVLSGMDFLLAFLEEARKKWASDTPLGEGIDEAWAILDKYYDLTDCCPVYIVAIVLDPQMKFQYFERKWESRPSWIGMAKEVLFEFWRDYNISCSEESEASDLNNENEEKGETVMNIDDWCFGVEDIQYIRDELEEYLRLPAIILKKENGSWESFDPL